MKVTFEHSLKGVIRTDLILERFQKDVLTLSLIVFNEESNERESEINTFFDKHQLEEFIGSLLHFQSKMRK